MREAVLASLARSVLGDPYATAQHPVVLGPYTLLPHQHEAVLRLTSIMQHHGGALLADAVGLGKTFVALAVARAYTSVDVIAPAGLLRMWRDTSERCEMRTVPECRLLHRFSFGSATARSVGAGNRLVIIDEAHHLRNPQTKRYANVAEHCRSAHVLLLTATPVHNRASDLAHLLALFLGARAQALSAAEQLALMVRRTAHVLEHAPEQVGAADGNARVPAAALPRAQAQIGARADSQLVARPELRTHPAVALHADDAIADTSRAITRELTDLPPPVPTRDGTAAGALIALGLLRSWCSSAAACLAAVRRRRARATALADVLAEGRWPSQQELRSWTISEDTVQLGFTSLLVEVGALTNEQPEHPTVTGAAAAFAGRIKRAREQLDTHQQALSTLELLVRRVEPSVDRARAESLRRIRRRHPGVTVIVFTQFADTVHAMGRVLRWDVGVATLTARGGRVAGGPLSRADLLRRVAPVAHGVAPPPPHERILLLLTTDLLAEGVNLQDAGVVVHLDLPWTPAAIAQREGRIARLGSAHRIVHAYAISPPGDGDALLRIASRLRRKARAMMVVLAPDAAPRRSARLVALPGLSSPVQETLWRWRRAGGRAANVPREMLVSHNRAGWLAAVDGHLVGGWFTSAGRRPNLHTGSPPRTSASRDPRTLAALVRAVEESITTSPAGAPLDISAFTHSIRTALHRESRQLHRATVVDTLQSPIVRAQRHIRRTLATVSLGDRMRLAPLASAATSAVRSLRGAGDERALQSLLDTSASEQSPEHWLRAVVALANQSRGGTANDQAARSDLPPDRNSSAANTIAPWQTLLLLLP